MHKKLLIELQLLIGQISMQLGNCEAGEQIFRDKIKYCLKTQQLLWLQRVEESFLRTFSLYQPRNAHLMLALIFEEFTHLDKARE